MFKIKCSCGELLQSENSLVGKVIRCKNCERAIKIEAAPDGSTRAIALAPEVSLPEFVKKACNAMRAGEFAVNDKICLECGSVNSVDRTTCAVCGSAWTMDNETESVSMDVTDDARNQTEDDEDLSKYVAPRSEQPESESSEVDEVVKNAGEFQLVGDDSIGEIPEGGESENPDEGGKEFPPDDAGEGPRIPQRPPMMRRFKPHHKGGSGYKKRRPFK